MDNTSASSSKSKTFPGDTTFQIRNRFSSLSKTNQRIASFILDNVDDFPSLTISQLAKKVRSSPASITRFCQLFGFSGLTELRYYLSNNTSSFVMEDKYISPNESFSSVKNKTSQLYLQVVNETIALIDDNLLELAVHHILEADRVFLFSQGVSSIAAQYAQMELMQVGLLCHFYSDYLISKYAATSITPHDVAIGISFSGKSKTTVDALQIAHKRNAFTMCITGFSNSRLAKYSNIVLGYNCKIDDDIRTMNLARVCEIGIITLLSNCILSKNYEHLSQKAELLNEAVRIGRY